MDVETQVGSTTITGTQDGLGLTAGMGYEFRATRHLTLGPQVDFAYAKPHDRVVVQARIILTPHNARELVNLLLMQLETPTDPVPP